MQVAHTPTGQAESHHHRRQSTFPWPTGSDAYNLGLPLPSDEEFLSRFGDTIDDRIAEILDELLAERSSARQRWRLPYALGIFSLVLATLAVSLLAWHTM